MKCLISTRANKNISQNFINRKHGKEEIIYDLPETEEYLKETYGITVYQEQVMLLSQKIGKFHQRRSRYTEKGYGEKTN